MAGTYGIPHRRFLQGMMCRKVCNTAEVKALFEASFAEKPQNFDSHIALFLRLLNLRIRPYNMEIRKGIDELNGSHCYCLVNCQDSEISRQASEYTPVELDYFKNLVSAIVSSPEGRVTSIAALNLAHTLTKQISATEVEELLKRLVENKWIFQFRGIVGLSVRSIVEFGGYIREVFPDDFRMCGLCKQLLLLGEDCTKCDARCHHHCVRRVSLKKCPRCSSVWSSRHSDAGTRRSSAAADDGDDADPSTLSMPPSQTKRRRKTRSGKD